MKQNLFVALLLLLISSCAAQTKGTAGLYGYKQPVSPGIMPQRSIDEQGRETTAAAKQQFNYYIYVTSPSTIHPSEIWISGRPYSASVDLISKTHVEHPAAGGDSLVLVPETKDRIIQLHLAPAIESKLSAKGRELSSSNELVVIYKSAGKFYYGTLGKLTVLDATPMQ